MKKIKICITVIILITSFGFSSCSSDDNSTPSDETYIRFTVGGEDFNYTNPATAGSLNLTINGQNRNDNIAATFSSISIWFPLQITTGTFNFSGDFFVNGDYKLNFESTLLSVDGWSDAGSVTITSISSEYIEGTFTGTVGGVNITNGEFRALNL